METATETNTHNRELTATEIQIAIAQIQDRLMRLGRAQDELTLFCGDEPSAEYQKLMDGIPEDQCNNESEKIINDKRATLRSKYDIPDGVYLFYECIESAFTTREAKICKPHLSAWVRGKLTPDQCWDIYLYFEEVSQADWGWVMLERPLGYYDAKSDTDREAIRIEMESIGTRLRSKNTKLPQIAGVFPA